MKPSILSSAEQKFVQERILGVRRQQLEGLSQDHVLAEFLATCATESVIVAFEKDGTRVAWSQKTGFEVQFAPDFLNDNAQLAQCFLKVRKAFFEDLLDEEALKSLVGTRVSEGASAMKFETSVPQAAEPVAEEAAPEPEPEPEPEMVEEELVEVEGEEELLEEVALFGDEEEPVAEEEATSESDEALAEEAPSEDVAGPIPEEALTDLEDDFDPDAMLAAVSDANSTIEIDEDAALAADEFSNLSAGDDEVHGAHHIEEAPVVEEPEASAEAEPESPGEPEAPVSSGDPIEDLKAEMIAKGMDEAKMNKLLTAVKSGRATVDAVRQTLQRAG